ncbi:MAG: hypothetical protein Q7S66_01025 [bacterium]|nr:hypothetical protein [bacterium]
MEKIEQIKTPDIHSQQLLQIIDNVKWEEMEELEYNGTNFLLFFPDETAESDGHQDAVYHQSTVADFDIYILSTLPVQEKKRCLFHEIVEADLRKQGFGNKEAHSIVEKEEQKIFGNRQK